jgi:hypothetical protein
MRTGGLSETGGSTWSWPWTNPEQERNTKNRTRPKCGGGGAGEARPAPSTGRARVERKGRKTEGRGCYLGEEVVLVVPAALARSDGCGGGRRRRTPNRLCHIPLRRTPFVRLPPAAASMYGAVSQGTRGGDAAFRVAAGSIEVGVDLSAARVYLIAK